MGKALLVITEIETGAEALSALDEAGLNIKVAAWCVFPHYGDWRLVLASKKLAAPFDGIPLVLQAFKAHGLPINRQPVFLIMGMSDPFIRDMRRYFKRPQDVAGQRLNLLSFGGQFLEDGYVYRVE